MPKVSVNGIKFHYWRVGNGPDIVMLHGLFSNLAAWHLKVVPELRREYRVMTYDLRGHGYSDMPPMGYSTHDMAEDLRGILEALGIERVHLVGHSLGADIAFHFSLLYPHSVVKMVAIEAGLPELMRLYKQDKDWEGWAYWANMLEQLAGIKVPREKWHDVEFMLRASLDVPYVFGLARGLPRKKEPILRLMTTTTIMQDYPDVVGDLTVENLAKIPHPTLLVYDANSPYLRSYAVLRDRLVNCSPVLLPNSETRHFSPLEQPDLLLAHIKTFLRPDEPGASALQEGKQD